MKESVKMLLLDSFEQRVLIEALADRRNDFIEAEKPTDDVNSVLLKVIDAPDKKRSRDEREAR